MKICGSKEDIRHFLPSDLLKLKLLRKRKRKKEEE
jgi:hypothetical protein